MPSMIQQYLAEVEGHLQRIKPELPPRLNPGLQRAEWILKCATLNIALPNEVFELYSWHDGTRTDWTKDKIRDVCLFPGFYFPSIQESICTYRSLSKEVFWNPAWFPVFDSGGGDYRPVDSSRTREESAPIIWFILSEQQQPVGFDSLTSMMHTLAVCFERGIIYVNEEGELKARIDPWNECRRSLNPSSHQD